MTKPTVLEIETLLELAAQAAHNAYAPYSGFCVGAAVLAEDGHTFAGCNVENASYGLTVCAERTAVGKAVSEGARRFAAAAVVGPPGQAAPRPCGACRQVLAEFSDGTCPVAVASLDRLAEYVILTLDELLPDAFRLQPGGR